MRRTRALLGAALPLCLWAADKSRNKEQPSVLDSYIEEANARGAPPAGASPGSLWNPTAWLTDLGADVRASRVDDIVTIVVAESASAVSQGTVKHQRKSAASASIAALGKVNPPGGALANLARISGETGYEGEGGTSRQTQLSTTLSARVTHVLPNGNLVLAGQKTVTVNSEQQVIAVRGVIRRLDLGPDNSVPSDRLAQMEVRVNGKGVVGDAVRRPFFLYRLLLGLLPF